jgi:predicted regulator of Ras-like GTPase activity (Roadblock/LC7/MglB family)
MSKRQDQILQNLVTRFPYIEYACLVSEEAELMSQPVGHWLNQDEGNEEIIIGKILYVMQEMGLALASEKAEQEVVEQIWIKLEHGHVIMLQCRPDVFLFVQTNNKAYLGELRKVVEGAAKSVQQLLDTDNQFSYTETEAINPTEASLANLEQPYVSKIANTPGKLRGREFIE